MRKKISLRYHVYALSGAENDVSPAEKVAACLVADLVLHNTKIYTANDAQWTAEATAVLGDKIIFVGSNADAAKYMCGDAQIMDMAGKSLIKNRYDI